MWSYYPQLLARPVPRYTSFPTAAEFSPAVAGEALDEALRTVSGEVSLYVHIPFCEQICWYCGCNTGAANKRQRLASYLDALEQEINLVSSRLGRRVDVRRVAFGGGSPNALSPVDFLRLVNTLTIRFGLQDPVWSIELDPRNLDEKWGQVLKCVGVTRASLGVQTFSPRLQEAIGRVQPVSMIEHCTDMLRNSGINSLNFDLMYGLPGQEWADLEDSLRQAVTIGADRIALFGYAHVPEMMPRQRRIDATHLPDQATRFAMADMGYQLLLNEGYVPVGFDHFAKPGDALAQATTAGHLRRNFQGFTEDQAPVLIGLGASAISSFPQVIVQNEKNAGRYRMMVSQAKVPGVLGVRRDADDQRRGDIIMALLCQGSAFIGPDLAMMQAENLAPFIAHGLAEVEAGVLNILPGGLPYARTIAALFDPYRQASARKFSSAV